MSTPSISEYWDSRYPDRLFPPFVFNWAPAPPRHWGATHQELLELAEENQKNNSHKDNILKNDTQKTNYIKIPSLASPMFIFVTLTIVVIIFRYC